MNVERRNITKKPDTRNNINCYTGNDAIFGCTGIKNIFTDSHASNTLYAFPVLNFQTLRVHSYSRFTATPSCVLLAAPVPFTLRICTPPA